MTKKRDPFGYIENNTWHIIETVDLLKRMPLVDFGMGILVRARVIPNFLQTSLKEMVTLGYLGQQAEEYLSVFWIICVTV